MKGSKRKKRAERDLKGIEGLDKFDEYAPSDPNTNANTDTHHADNNDTLNADNGDTHMDANNGSTNDDLILHQLFSKSGVHSALQHDSIMDRTHHEDTIANDESTRIANASILALKVSRQQVRYAQQRQSQNGSQSNGNSVRSESNNGEGIKGVVQTWTGKNGVAGDKRSGPSSSSILAKMRERSSGSFGKVCSFTH